MPNVEEFLLPSGECRFDSLQRTIDQWLNTPVKLSPLESLGDEFSRAIHEAIGQLDIRLRIHGVDKVADQLRSLSVGGKRFLAEAGRDNHLPTNVPAMMDGLEGPEYVDCPVHVFAEYVRFAGEALSSVNDEDRVTSTTGKRLPRNEFTEESRPTGQWASLCGCTGQSFRHRMSAEEPGETWRISLLKYQRYIVHIDDLPEGVRGSKRLRDDKLKHVIAKQV